MASPPLPPAPTERRRPALPPPPVFVRPRVIPGVPPLPQRTRSSPGRAWLWIAVISITLLVAGAAGEWAINGQGEFGFLESRGPAASPTRWNPCAPIHYVVNLTGAPSTALGDLDEAISRVTEETEVPFVFDGLTDESVAARLGEEQPVEYGPDGAQWKPVLIAWEGREDWVALGGRAGAKGFGYPVPADAGGYRVYVTGMIVIHAEPAGYPAFPPGFGEQGSQGVVLQHELGHLMGLAHVDSLRELMFTGDEIEPTVRDWGPGDRRGLARLGRDAGCLRTPAAPAPGLQPAL